MKRILCSERTFRKKCHSNWNPHPTVINNTYYAIVYTIAYTKYNIKVGFSGLIWPVYISESHEVN